MTRPRRPPLLVPSAALLALTGCFTQISHLPDSRPLPQPTPIAVAGTGVAPGAGYTHPPSGYAFPPTAAGFARVSLVQYDTAGLDISAGYNGAPDGCPVVATVYVYPAPRMTFIGADPALVRSMEADWLARATAQAQQEIVAAHPTARLQAEDARVQDGVPGRKAVYAFDDKTSELYLFVVDRQWFLKYRHTYPTACAGQARAALQRLHDALPRRPAG